MNLDKIKMREEHRDRLFEIICNNRRILIEDVEEVKGANLPPYTPKFLSNQPIFQKQYRIPHKLHDPIRKKLDGLEKAGIISKTCSNWNTPVMFLEKKAPSTDIRMVLDLRQINQVVETFNYPLMRIDEIIDRLGGSKVFSTLDLNNGYFNVKLDESVKDNFAFSAPFGRYRMERLPQGLSTSAGWFQKVMNEALHDVISDGHCMVFQDDVIVFTDTIEDHLRVLDMVMMALKRINMAIRPSKCVLFKESLKFLGHIVDKDGSRPTNENVEAVEKFERPRTIKQVRSFLGTVNFYRKFIPGITEVADPLYQLLKKSNTKLTWDEQAEVAFLKLKERLVKAPLLMYPNFNKDFVIKTDASGIGVGAVLEQKNADDELQPIAFCSRKLNAAERRYSAIEREALAIVYALAQFKHITYGYRIILYTDHKPLSYIFKLKDTNMRLVRWLLQIQDHNILIEYKPGRFNFVADWLSRAHSDDTPLVTIAASHLNQNISVEKVIAAQREDPYCKRMLDRIKDGSIDNLPFSTDNDGILIQRVIPSRFNGWKYRVVAPLKLRQQIMSLYHDGLTGGHMSAGLTMWRIRLLFTWYGMSTDIRKFVQTCDNCQRRSIPRSKVPFQYVHPPRAPMSRISVDILGPFSVTRNRNKYVLVWVDHFSRMTFASPLRNIEAETVANDYINNIYPKYGASNEIVSDRGGQFTGSVVRALYKLLRIKGIYTSPYNPQGNGITERTNSKILRVLSHLCESQYGKWDELLPFVIQNLNNSVHRSINETPFYVFHGFDQIHPGTPLGSNDDEPDIQMPEIIARANQQIIESRERVVEQLSQSSMRNSGDEELRGLMPGEVVLYLDSTSFAGKNRKLKERYKGPYRVVGQTGMVNYKIKKLDGSHEEKVVHLNKLKKYHHREMLDDQMDNSCFSKFTSKAIPCSRPDTSNQPPKHSVRRSARLGKK